MWPDKQVADVKQVQFAGQPVRPSKIVCVGRNYAAHIDELGNAVPDAPVLFIKPNSTIAEAPLADPDTEIHYETEITLLVRDGRIAGVGLGLDLTRRELQRRLQQAGLPWERAKAFDGSAVFSDFVAFDGDPDQLHLTLEINGHQAQAGGSQLMLTRPAALLAEISREFTLFDDDLVMTGTPRGVGPLIPGDRYQARLYDGDRPLVQANWTVGHAD